MKLKKILLTILIIVFSFIFFSMGSLADFGNFDTYDSGWDSGWDSSSDWGTDWGSDDGYIFYSDSGSDSNEDTDIGALIIVVLIIIIIVTVQYKRNKNGKGTARRTGNYRNVQRGTYSASEYQNKTTEIGAQIRSGGDEAFSTDNFLAFVNEAYVRLQSAWSDRDIEQIRLLLTPELYSQTLRQIEEYRRLGRINVLERIAVQESYLTSYYSDNEKETLSVYLYATQKDYIKDEKNGNVVEGTDSEYRHSKYLITLIRATGVKTESSDGIEAANCPNCGAPLEITASGRCAYCDSVIRSSEHSWVISQIRRVN